MPSPSAVLSSVVLVTGLCLPGQDKWQPLYDYTNLPPSNLTYWEPLQQAKVQMEDALALAAQTEGAPVHALSAALRTDTGEPQWDLQLFVAAEKAQPKRVNLQVSTTEPKVLRRLELLSVTEHDKKIWKVLVRTGVTAEAAIEICKDHSSGNRPQPVIRDPRLRTLAFVPEPDAPIWDCELMGDDWKKEQIRRYQYHVTAGKPGVRRKILLDRFAGEPLRSGEPTELPNGIFTYDFIIGEGPEVTEDSKVKVHYRLFLLDNTKLHDTWDTKRPETFQLSSAPLKGMTAGMLGMHMGGRRKIVMPYQLAFGDAGNELAPPKAMVVCDLAVIGLPPQ